MKLNPGSVVYGRMGDDLNNPALPSASTVATLQGAGVRRVVVGHTPSGDTPSVLRALTAGGPFELVVADNSRSRVESGSRLLVRDDALSVVARVVLDGGAARTVDARLPLADAASPLGRRTADGALVKHRFDDGWLTFRYDPGWQATQTLREELGPVAEAW